MLSNLKTLTFTAVYQLTSEFTGNCFNQGKNKLAVITYDKAMDKEIMF